MAKGNKTLDTDFIKELCEVVKEYELAELEVEEGTTKIKIKKSHEPQIAYASPQTSISNPISMPLSGVIESSASGISPVTPLVEGAEEIKSPMVGTFYRAPGPGKPAFVEKGSEVKKGEVLCIVEAMKIMNDIKSTTDGKVIDILVENGEAVEYGQPLFVIQKK